MEMSEEKERFIYEVVVNLNVFKPGIGYSTKSWKSMEFESLEEAEGIWKQLGELLEKLPLTETEAE